MKRKSVAILTALILCISLLFPFGNIAGAYGITNHEKVVDAGDMHFVVLQDDGTVWSWGDNNYGQLGAKESSNHSTVPVRVRLDNGATLDNIKSIAAGGYHSVALDNDGYVWTWGLNAYGQLGQDQDRSVLPLNNSPKRINDGSIDTSMGLVKAIAAGEQHTLAVDLQGRVWAWGFNEYGQLGQPTSVKYSNKPVLVSGVNDVVAVAAGANHSVALTSDGKVYAWGRGNEGQVGNGQTRDKNDTPELVRNLTGIMEIAAGDNHTLALKHDRTTIYAWGSNNYGQLGDGGYDAKLTPIQVSGISGVKMISAGNDHSIAIKDDGTVWTWGRNTSGNQTSRSTPIQLDGVTNAISIGGGGGAMNSFTLVVSQDGSLYYWDQSSSNPTTNLPIVKKVHGIYKVMRTIEYPYVQGGQVVFLYSGNASNVEIIGDFNNWVELSLSRISASDWTKQIELQPGTYSYGYKIDGNIIPDPLNRVKKITQTGAVLSELKVPEYATEGPIINDNQVTFTYNSYDHTGKLEYDAETTYVAVRGSFNNFVDIPLVLQPNNTWAVTTTVAPGEYYYYFVVRDKDSLQDEEKRLDVLNPNVHTDFLGIKTSTFKVKDKIEAKIPVTGIELNVGPTMDLVVGEEYTLQALLTPADATNKKVNWTSTNDSIVSVDEDGKLTAHAVGNATIIATTDDGGKTAFVNITVYPQDNSVSYPRVGYEAIIPKGATNVDPNKVWYINFSDAFDLDSVNSSNVYVLRDDGQKIPVGYQISNDDKTLEVRLQSGYSYTPGRTYYLFIEDTVKSKYTKQNLTKKYQMKFQIKVD